MGLFIFIYYQSPSVIIIVIPVYLKKGDTLPRLEVTISGSNSAIDLTDATGSTFVYRQRYTGSAVVGTGGFVNKGSGIVFYNWQSSDTTTVGPYLGEFRILFSGNTQRSYPSNGYLVFEVHSGIL